MLLNDCASPSALNKALSYTLVRESGTRSIGRSSNRSRHCDALVKSITYCGDAYDVTTADGETAQFWERNLRFKTDGSDEGPKPGAPAIVGAGMMGDRASVIFASPEEFSKFIERECPPD